MAPYRWLAEYYDEIFAGFRAPMDAARERLLAGILPRAGSACDLACGTGATALVLANSGIPTYAVDLSPGMCRVARRKARGSGVPLRVIQADMRSFRLPEPVDLVLCEGDALNHVPRKQDLARVARAVARALVPGGHFFFDVNNRAGFAGYWKGSLWIERPGVVLVMRNGNDAANDRAWCDAEWFLREGRLWKRQRERVEEVCWSASEVRGALRAAGFETIRAWDAAPFWDDHALIRPGCRTWYLARKARG